jgi:hypothetical protein
MTRARFLYLAKCEREGSDSLVANKLERSGSRENRAEILLGGATGLAFLRLAGARGSTEVRCKFAS